MARTIAAALDRFLELLRDARTGFRAQLESIAARDRVSLRPVAGSSLLLLNASPELVDQSCDVEYPQLLVYGEQMENLHREKFAYFSGTLRLAAELRVSSETNERLEADLHRYVEALLNVLDQATAEWESGLVYTGRYAVSWAPMRLGGHNFLQTARVSFVLDQFVAG